MSVQTIKADELVEDFDLYPRGDVDSSHVASLVEALEAGATLPPIIACKKTKRIVDGFHRRRALIRYSGEGVVIPVVFKTYKSDGELYAEAMSANSSHGRRLTAVDFSRAMTKGRALGLDDATIAKCLHLTVDKVTELVIDRTARHGRISVPLKRTISHMAGKQLTKPQVDANDRLSGMTQVFYVNQIITLIESKLLNKEDAKLLSRLRVLHGLLDDILVA
jgi:hypothetical protein